MDSGSVQGLNRSGLFSLEISNVTFNLGVDGESGPLENCHRGREHTLRASRAGEELSSRNRGLMSVDGDFDRRIENSRCSVRDPASRGTIRMAGRSRLDSGLLPFVLEGHRRVSESGIDPTCQR